MFFDMANLFGILDRSVNRFGYWYTFVTLIGGSALVGSITSWLSSSVDTVSQYGWLGWWVAFWCGAILFLIAVLLSFGGSSLRMHSILSKKWSKEVENVNPLESEFNKKRIKWTHLAHPSKKTVKGKKFYGCELYGPVNLFFQNNVVFQGSVLSECNVVVVHPRRDGTIQPMLNMMLVSDCEFHGGEVFQATIFILPDMVRQFQAMNFTFATLTGFEDIDKQLLPVDELLKRRANLQK